MRFELQAIAKEELTSNVYVNQVSLRNVGDWIAGAAPGILITKQLADTGRYPEEQRKEEAQELLQNHFPNANSGDDSPPARASEPQHSSLLPAPEETTFRAVRARVLALRLHELHCVK